MEVQQRSRNRERRTSSGGAAPSGYAVAVTAKGADGYEQGGEGCGPGPEDERRGGGDICPLPPSHDRMVLLSNEKQLSNAYFPESYFPGLMLFVYLWNA